MPLDNRRKLVYKKKLVSLESLVQKLLKQSAMRDKNTHAISDSQAHHC